MVLVVFRPDQEAARERVQARLRKLHAQSPGAHVVSQLSLLSQLLEQGLGLVRSAGTNLDLNIP